MHIAENMQSAGVFHLNHYNETNRNRNIHNTSHSKEHNLQNNRCNILDMTLMQEIQMKDVMQDGMQDEIPSLLFISLATSHMMGAEDTTKQAILLVWGNICAQIIQT